MGACECDAAVLLLLLLSPATRVASALPASGTIRFNDRNWISLFAASLLHLSPCAP